MKSGYCEQTSVWTVCILVSCIRPCTTWTMRTTTQMTYSFWTQRTTPKIGTLPLWWWWCVFRRTAPHRLLWKSRSRFRGAIVYGTSKTVPTPFFLWKMAPSTKPFCRAPSYDAEREPEPQRSPIKWGANDHCQWHVVNICLVCGVTASPTTPVWVCRGGWRWSVGGFGLAIPTHLSLQINDL